jgi:hypothetical protein
MPRKEHSKKAPRGRQRLEQDRVGNLFADVPDETGKGNLRILFRRNWYSPPHTDEGEIDYQRAAEELSSELTGGTLVVRRYLENGDLGYAAELPLASKDELEQLLCTMRRVFVEGLKHDNAIRQVGLEACEARIAEPGRSTHLVLDRRQDMERRSRARRGRQLLGRAWFRRSDRRLETDRRCGKERRTA